MKIMKAYRFLILLLFAAIATSCDDKDETGSFYQLEEFIDVKAYCKRVQAEALSFDYSMYKMLKFRLIFVHDEEASTARESENERLEKEIYDYILDHEPMFDHIPYYVSVIDDSVEEIKITANKTLFGIEAGEELNSHFSVTSIDNNSIVTYREGIVESVKQRDPDLFSPVVNGIMRPEYMLLTGVCFMAHDIPEYYDYDDVTITVYLRLTSGAEFTAEVEIPLYN